VAGDKSKRDFRDRDRVSSDEDYEVEYFASKTGITPQQVRELIAKHGNSRETLEREAQALRGRARGRCLTWPSPRSGNRNRLVALCVCIARSRKLAFVR